jgi:ubiquinone/menaquinone biosynthesis C-methylase UbiE
MAGFDHFEWLAPLYDRIIQSKEPDKIIHLAGLPIIGSLLDVGGGTGRIGETLKGQAGSIIISDPSIKMLQRALGKNGLRTIGSAAEYLPFVDCSFEVVIMVDALHHVNDQARTAAEMFRVLKPGGRIVIEEPDIRRPVVKIIAIIEKLALMRSHFLSPAKMAKLFVFQHARTRIEWEGFNAWVIVDKIPQPDISFK